MVVSLKSDHDAFMELSRNMATMYMNRSGNYFVTYSGNDFINTVGMALNLTPDDEKMKEGSPGDAVFFSPEVVETMKPIVDAIRDYGGNEPDIIIYPVLLQIIDTKNLFDSVVCLPLFRVRNKYYAETSAYIDTNGRSYSDEDDFKVNVQYPPAKMSYPKELLFQPDENGNAEVVYTDVNTSKVMQNVDLTVNLLCLGAGAVLMFTGVGAPAGIAIGATCAGYGITRSVQTLIDRYKHGQSLNPLNDWESFNAWAGIAANAVGFGYAAKTIRLSGQVAQMAQEGLRISESTQLAVKASIVIPHAINGGIMMIQLYQLIESWDRIPAENKIMIGLQFLFFAAATYKMNVLTVAGIEENVNNVVYNELREQLPYDDSIPVRSDLDTATDVLGGKNHRTINFFKKLVNYHKGALITASVSDKFESLISLSKEGDEMGFKLRQKYFCGPEAAIQVNYELENNGAGSSTDRPDEYRLPRTGQASENTLDEILGMKRFVDINKIEESENWLKNHLEVDNLENFQVNNKAIFEKMAYHDRIRLRIFEEIGKGLNKSLIKACLKYAQEQDVKTVGQFASEYEISSLQIHKLANELANTIKDMAPAEVKQRYGIDMTTAIENRMEYSDIPKQRTNIMFADEPDQRNLNKMNKNAMNSMGRADAGAIIENWKTSIRIPEAKTISSPEADLQTLANDIINAGDLAFPKPEYQSINAATFFSKYGDVDVGQFPRIFLDDANATILSCRGSIESQVFDVTRPKDTNVRRLVFWSLDDENYAKSTVVAVNKNTGEVRIQNFSVNKSKTSANVTKNPKQAVFDYWETNFDYENVKTSLRTMVDSIKTECEEYVGPQMVRAGLNHDQTVGDIQSLSSIRFASLEHAICHVLKHGENLSNTELVAEVRNYFNKAQEVIQSTLDHPENVSSSWTQTGSARDFIFYRKLPNVGVEKVVVLVREGGEVIMKTYFVDNNMADIPTQVKHNYQDPVDIKHVDLRTFYFQLMIMAPRYGVLLPRNYEIIGSGSNSEMTRTILIMAGHYFKDDGSVNAIDLGRAVNSVFPVTDLKWIVIAMKTGEFFSYLIDYQAHYYVAAKIKNYRFVVYIERPSTKSDAIVKPGAKEKYGRYANNVKVIQSIGFDTDALDLACRICSHSKYASPIKKAMDESFGEIWNCFILSTYYSLFNIQRCYLRVNLDNGTHCIVFR